MDKIRLDPKFKTIEEELIKNNVSHNPKEAPVNAFVELNAHMIAQGLQLAEDANKEN